MTSPSQPQSGSLREVEGRLNEYGDAVAFAAQSQGGTKAVALTRAALLAAVQEIVRERDEAELNWQNEIGLHEQLVREIGRLRAALELARKDAERWLRKTGDH